jgi:hypothetical protein
VIADLAVTRPDALDAILRETARSWSHNASPEVDTAEPMS